MPNKVMVAGVNKTAYVHRPSNVTINRNLNERHMASLTFTPGFVPSRLDAIEIYAEDDVTLLFSGLIINRNLHGVFTESWESMVSVECADYSTYLDWYYIDLSYTADTTLDTVLTAIVAALPAGYGITKGGSGYTDVIKPFTWTAMRASDALRELSNATGRGLKMLVKALSMPTLPDGSAPKNYADGGVTPRETSWEDPSDVPANTVILSCGPTGSAYHTYAWTADGSASSWQMDIPAAGPGVSRTLLLVIGGNNVYATVDEGAGGWFTWNWATRTISVNSYPLTLPIPNGTAMSFEYLAQYPFSVVRPASLPATPIVALFKDETITEYARGVDAADGLLDKIGGQPRSVDIRDGTHGWQPGQSLSISMSGSRSLNASAMVKSVELTLYEAGGWEYINTIVENTVYDGSYLDKWRSMSGSSSGVAVLGGGSGGGGGGTTVVSAGSAHLGGSRTECVATTTWTPIPSYQVFRCLTTGTYSFYVEKKTEDVGTTVSVRLYDLTDDVAVTGSTTPATAPPIWDDAALFVALIAGHTYQAEMQGGNDTASILVGQASLDSAPAAPDVEPPVSVSGSSAFTWAAVGGASSYVLQVGTTAALSDIYDQNVGNVLTYALPLNAGTYYWRVVPVGAGSVSTTRQITVASDNPWDTGETTTAVLLGENLLGKFIFPKDHWWNLRVDSAPLDPNGQQYIDDVFYGGGFTQFEGGVDHVPYYGEYGFPWVTVGRNQPLVTNIQWTWPTVSDAGAPGEPDGYPIPEEAKTQENFIQGGAPGGIGDTGDRHMIIIDRDRGILYELYGVEWRPDLGTNGMWDIGCGAAWWFKDKRRRPDQWPSGDAAGLELYPAFGKYDEMLHADPDFEIEHGHRFTLGGNYSYVWPASHSFTNYTYNEPAKPSYGHQYPPYGTRFRLKATFDIDQAIPQSGGVTWRQNPHALRWVRCLQRYGIMHCDIGGWMKITGAFDNRWNNATAPNDPWLWCMGFGGSDWEMVERGWGETPVSPDTFAVGTSGGVAKLTWTHDGVNLDHFELTVDGGTPTNIGKPLVSGQSYAYTVPALAAGQHTLVVSAIGDSKTALSTTMSLAVM